MSSLRLVSSLVSIDSFDEEDMGRVVVPTLGLLVFWLSIVIDSSKGILSSLLVVSRS